MASVYMQCFSESKYMMLSLQVNRRNLKGELGVLGKSSKERTTSTWKADSENNKALAFR